MIPKTKIGLVMDFVKTLFKWSSGFRVYTKPFHLTMTKMLKHSLIVMVFFSMFLVIAEDATRHGETYSYWDTYSKPSFFGKMFAPEEYYNGKHFRKKYPLIHNKVIYPSASTDSILNPSNTAAILLYIIVASILYGVYHRVVRSIIWYTASIICTAVLPEEKRQKVLFKYFERFKPLKILKWEDLNQRTSQYAEGTILDELPINIPNKPEGNDLGGSNEWIVED